METTFYIIFRLRTDKGFEAYGTFNLGNDRRAARRIFAQLEGREAAAETDILHLDLMEMSHGLPVNLQVLSCTAAELAANVKCITREMFKILNLEANDL